MKKLLSLLIICSIFVTQCLTVFAESPVTKDSSANLESNNVKAIVALKDDKDDKTNVLVLKENQEGFEEDVYKPSKWEITKNIAKYLGKAFIDDVKSYIMFYPLLKVAQAISFLAIFFPTYVLYKKTGIDIPAKVSRVFTKNESLNIIGQNLYNLIPLTLASFMFKWGRDLYLFAKS